jgi:hypothetical protein
VATKAIDFVFFAENCAGIWERIRNPVHGVRSSGLCPQEEGFAAIKSAFF